MKSTIRVCVVYSRDLAGMPMITHGSENFREPQPGSEYPQTAKTAINGRRVKGGLPYNTDCFSYIRHNSGELCCHATALVFLKVIFLVHYH